MANSTIADKFLKAVPKFFQVGGFPLVFGTGGLVLIILAGAIGGRQLSRVEFWAGCVLTFVCLAYYIADAVAKVRATAPLPIASEVQEMSSLVKEISSMCQSIAFRYEGYIQEALRAVNNVAARFPFADGILKAIGIAELESYSKTVVAATESVKKISDDIEAAVRNGDIERMREYAAKLRGILQDLRDFLTR